MVSRLFPSHPSPVTSRPTLCSQSLSVISGWRLSFISNQQAHALLSIALDEQPVPLSSSPSLEGLSLDSLSVASPPTWVLDALTVGLRKGLREEFVTYTLWHVTNVGTGKLKHYVYARSFSPHAFVIVLRSKFCGLSTQNNSRVATGFIVWCPLCENEMIIMESQSTTKQW